MHRVAVRLILAMGIMIGTMATYAQTDPWSGKTLRVTAQSWIIDKWPLEDAAKAFMADHPGSKVVVAPTLDKGEGDPYLLQWARNRTDTDLALGGSPADISIYVARDLLAEFGDDFFEKLPRDTYVDSLLEQGQYGGTQYSIPLLGEVISLNVRTDLMAEAGLVDENGRPIPPQSWDDVYDYAQKLTHTAADGTIDVYGLSIDLGTNFVLLNYYSGLQAATGHFLADDGVNIDVSSQASTNLLTFWDRVTADGFAQPNTLQDQNAGRNAFKAGGIAMLWTASSRTQEFAEVFGADKVSTLALPGAADNGSIAFTHGIYIPKASPVPEMAKAFVREQLMAKDAQQWSALHYGKLPTIKANYDGLPADLSDLLLTVQKSQSEPLYEEQGKLTDLFHTQISNLILLDQDVAQTQSNLQSGMDGIGLTVFGQ